MLWTIFEICKEDNKPKLLFKIHSINRFGAIYQAKCLLRNKKYWRIDAFNLPEENDYFFRNYKIKVDSLNKIKKVV